MQWQNIGNQGENIARTRWGIIRKRILIAKTGMTYIVLILMSKFLLSVV